MNITSNWTTGLGTQELDTKANLLYKLGGKCKAMVCEEKSMNLASNAKDAVITLQKMKSGLPT